MIRICAHQIKNYNTVYLYHMMLYPRFQIGICFFHVYLAQFIASKHLRAKQWQGAQRRDYIYEK